MRAPEVGALTITASQLPPNVPMTLIRTCARHNSIHVLVMQTWNFPPPLTWSVPQALTTVILTENSKELAS